jgi:hypothetical protein
MTIFEHVKKYICGDQLLKGISSATSETGTITGFIYCNDETKLRINV